MFMNKPRLPSAGAYMLNLIVYRRLLLYDERAPHVIGAVGQAVECVRSRWNLRNDYPVLLARGGEQRATQIRGAAWHRGIESTPDTGGHAPTLEHDAVWRSATHLKNDHVLGMDRE